MRPLSRRTFLATCSRAGFGVAALAALPRWAHAGFGATAPRGIIVRNEWPEHWETEVQTLGRDWITANETFFVRSHLDAPAIDPETWQLEVTGLVAHPLTLSLDQLRAMPHVERVHTLECAGNGRGLFHPASTSGTQWERGAVGNARWGGVALETVLERAAAAGSARHVWFEAADRAPLATAPRFVRSIPIEKAKADTLLAWSMNGMPLPRLHGAPLRAIVPGWYGMASTKWVTRIRLEDKPSDNHFMVRGYRYNAPGQDPVGSPPVETMRVKSLITYPLEGARIRPGAIIIQGFAWAGPAGLKRVEVSVDGGRTWQVARFTGDSAPLAWRRWDVEVMLAHGPRTLMARATDGTGAAQPLQTALNAGGYGNNSIHQVNVDATG
jgi:DMSO/TMAO reductase YedYZ molybdopterin-dependent catalytic subunit